MPGSPTYRVNSLADLERLIATLRRAPFGYFVTCKRNKRSDEQNNRMWAMLTKLSDGLLWHGQRMSPEDWKLIMMAGLNQELRVVPNIEGNGLVQLGRSSSKLSVQEMTALMDLIEAFAAQHGVDLEEPGEQAA